MEILNALGVDASEKLRATGVDLHIKKGTSWDAPIRKQQLIDPVTGQPSNAYGVWLKDDDDTDWSHVGTVSEKYVLVQNEKLVEIVENDILRNTGHTWTNDRIFFDGKRFSSFYTPEGYSIDVRPGDPITYGLMLRNSYDGSWSGSVELFMIQLVCGNGMISHQFMAGHRFRHMPESIDWDTDVQRALHIIAEAPERLSTVLSSFKTMATTRVDLSELGAVRGGPLSQKVIGAATWANVVDEFLDKQDFTLWGLLASATYETWNNGQMKAADFSKNQSVVEGMLQYV